MTTQLLTGIPGTGKTHHLTERALPFLLRRLHDAGISATSHTDEHTGSTHLEIDGWRRINVENLIDELAQTDPSKHEVRIERWVAFIMESGRIAEQSITDPDELRQRVRTRIIPADLAADSGLSIEVGRTRQETAWSLASQWNLGEHPGDPFGLVAGGVRHGDDGSTDSVEFDEASATKGRYVIDGWSRFGDDVPTPVVIARYADVADFASHGASRGRARGRPRRDDRRVLGVGQVHPGRGP